MNRLLSVLGVQTSGPGGGEGGAGEPLSNVMFVDKGTAVAAEDQNGSAGAPFVTMADAITALVAAGGPNHAHVLFATPGDYGSDTVNWDFDNGDFVVRGLLGVDSFMVWQSGSPSPKDGLKLPSVYIAATSAIARNLGLESVDCPYVSVILGTLHARASRLPYLEINNEAWCSGCELGSLTTAATVAVFTDCTFGGTPSVTFSGDPGELRLDPRSHYEFLAAGGTVTNGEIVPLSVSVYQPEGIVTSSASIYYNFLEADAGKYYRLTHATPEVQVPTNYLSAGAVPIGTRIRGVGTQGSVTIDPNGKTLNVPDGFLAATRAAFSPFEIVKVGASTWDLSGDLLAE